MNVYKLPIPEFQRKEVRKMEKGQTQPKLTSDRQVDPDLYTRETFPISPDEPYHLCGISFDKDNYPI